MLEKSRKREGVGLGKVRATIGKEKVKKWGWEKGRGRVEKGKSGRRRGRFKKTQKR